MKVFSCLFHLWICSTVAENSGSIRRLRLGRHQVRNETEDKGSFDSYEGSLKKERDHQGRHAGIPPALVGHPIIEELENVNTRYYVYGDCDILQCDLLTKLRESGPPNNEDLDHTMTDVRAEADIIKALKNHPLRTEDTLEASLYIVPLPISEMIAYGCQWDDCKWFEESVEALTKHPLFLEHHGNNHVLISEHWVAFNHRFHVQFPAMSLVYKKLTNVTVAMHFDPFGCKELANNPESTYGSGFTPLFQWEGEPLTRAFSVGLIGTTDLPFQAMTMEKFRQSEFLVFYHTRIVPFAFRSTKYRVALVSNATTTANLPDHTSIGFDIPTDQWMEHFLSSKFCIVIRGDTPHSHALLHSLRAGCIPVVVSDFYDDYAPSFKSTLSIKDWAIVIDEYAFLADPAGQIRALEELPLDYIEEKIANASLAQSIVLSESPMFVPAFLRESINANSLPAPTSSKIVAGSCGAHQRTSQFTFNGTIHRFQYPSSLSASIDLFHEAPVIVGVISKPENCARRQMIRQSWGRNRRVFFLLRGQDWSDLAEEFYQFGDILWMKDKTPSSSEAHETMILSLMFLRAIEQHVESYSHMILTNDNNYVDVDRIEMILHFRRPDYWSGCVAHNSTSSADDNDGAPISFSLPSRLGYVLSRKLCHCAAKKISDSSFSSSLVGIPVEDQAIIGILADRCGVRCEDYGWDEERNWDEHYFSNVATGREFFYLNERLLWKKQMSPYYEPIATEAEEELVDIEMT